MLDKLPKAETVSAFQTFTPMKVDQGLCPKSDKAPGVEWCLTNQRENWEG